MWLRSGSLGGKVTMVYPMTVLKGANSKTTVTSVALQTVQRGRRRGLRSSTMRHTPQAKWLVRVLA